MMNGLKIPRGGAHTNLLREGKVMWSQPLLIAATQRIPFTCGTDPPCLIITYHNNGAITPRGNCAHMAVQRCIGVSIHFRFLCTKCCDVIYFRELRVISKILFTVYVNVIFRKTTKT